MKKQLLFLSVIACLSLTSVSVDASPPVDVGYQHEPTIKLTAAVAPQQMIAITPVEYSFGCSTILTEDYSFTLPKVYEGYTSCATCAHSMDVQFVDTSTRLNHSVSSYMIDKRSIPELNFKYDEGRATEYRS